MHRSSSSRLGYDDRRSYGAGGSRSHGNEDRRRDQSRKSDSSAPREPSQVQIFIEGLPLDARIPDLVDYFSTVGKIKIDRDANKPRVWLYHDKRTGDPTGEATITYYDNETQRRALDTYNGNSSGRMCAPTTSLFVPSTRDFDPVARICLGRLHGRQS